MPVNLISCLFFAVDMSRPPSVSVTRPDPDDGTLTRLFKKEPNGKRVRRLHAIILMRQLGNAERVAELCLVDADTIRRWVDAFNERGLDGLFGKKTPAARRS